MSYELNIIHQVVQGNLSPLYFPTKPSEQAFLYKHLSEVPDTCTQQVHARFGQSDEQLITIESLEVRLLDRYRPPAFVALNHEVQVYEEQAGEVLLDMVLQRLSLASDSVIEWYHWQDENGSVHLELYANYPLDDLSFEERRYHFYQRLLVEQVALVQQSLLTYTFQATSKDIAQKYVQDHQQALLTYVALVKQQLDESDVQMYTFSGEYNLSDVFKHIFLGLEELISFIEQQFSEYLNVNAQIPYHHRVMLASQLSEQIQLVEQALIYSEIDKPLLNILSEAISRLKELPHREVNYLHLRYYRKLLQSLTNLVEKDSLNEEQIIRLLIQLNFNSADFIEWLITSIQEELEGHDNAGKKLEILHYYQKFCKQTSIQQDYALHPGKVSAGDQFLNWIKEEMAYLEKYPSLVSEPLLSITDEKVKTNLSVAQVSLLIKLFLEVDIFPEQNQNNIYRRFSEILSSTQQEEVSAKSLRAKFYQHDQHTITVLKDKVIAMLNYLNKIS